MSKPIVIINVAASLDGMIASPYKALELSNQEDWERVHTLRASVDAILVGINTIIKDNPQLTVRLNSKDTQIPEKTLYRVILDTYGRTPLSAEVLKNQEIFPTIIFTSRLCSLEVQRFAKTNNVNIEIVPVTSTTNHLDINCILEILSEKYNVKQLLVEGGSTIITSFLSSKIVHQMYLYLSPNFVGTKGGIPIWSSFTVEEINQALKFGIQSMDKLGEGILLSLKPLVI